MLPDRNSLKPEEFEDLDDDNPNTPANRHPNGSKSEIKKMYATMKIKRRIPDAHDSVYEIGADNAQQADPNISEGKTLTFEEEDEDPEDKQTSTYVKEVSNSEDIDAGVTSIRHSQDRLSTLEIKDVMGLLEAQKKLTFEKEDPGDPKADLDDIDLEAVDSEFTEKSEIENINVTIKTNFKLPQVEENDSASQENKECNQRLETPHCSINSYCNQKCDNLTSCDNYKKSIMTAQISH